MKLPVIFMLFALFACPATADADKNTRKMVEAAKSLKFGLSENRAYLLVKQETIVTPVAVVFGYMDNHAACLELADALSRSGSVGTFECSGVY